MPCVVLNNNRGKVGWSTHLFFILWFLGMATIGYSQSAIGNVRSEEHTSELQSRPHLVCRLLLEKKKPVSTRTLSSIRLHLTHVFPLYCTTNFFSYFLSVTTVKSYFSTNIMFTFTNYFQRLKSSK